jgi:hypothetical protein
MHIDNALSTLRDWCSLTLTKSQPGDVMHKLRQNASMLGAVLGSTPWIALPNPTSDLMEEIAKQVKGR